MATMSKFCRRIAAKSTTLAYRIKHKAASERGQGLTEYALLIGVLAIVGVLAATVLREPLTTLWNKVAETLNSVANPS